MFRELFFFSIERHRNPLFLVVKCSFQGMTGLPNFVLIFWRLNVHVATLNWQVRKTKILKFHFFCWLQQTQAATFVSLNQSWNYTQTVFLQMRIRSINSFLLTNQRSFYIIHWALISNSVIIGFLVFGISIGYNAKFTLSLNFSNKERYPSICIALTHLCKIYFLVQKVRHL